MRFSLTRGSACGVPEASAQGCCGLKSRFLFKSACPVHLWVPLLSPMLTEFYLWVWRAELLSFLHMYIRTALGSQTPHFPIPWQFTLQSFVPSNKRKIPFFKLLHSLTRTYLITTDPINIVSIEIDSNWWGVLISSTKSNCHIKVITPFRDKSYCSNTAHTWGKGAVWGMNTRLGILWAM